MVSGRQELKFRRPGHGCMSYTGPRASQSCASRARGCRTSHGLAREYAKSYKHSQRNGNGGRVGHPRPHVRAANHASAGRLHWPQRSKAAPPNTAGCCTTVHCSLPYTMLKPHIVTPQDRISGTVVVEQRTGMWTYNSTEPNRREECLPQRTQR